MIYALNLADDDRILSVTYDKYAPAHQPRVDLLPEGNPYEYRYVNGEYIHDPLPVPEQPELQPTQDERIAALEAQLAAYESAFAEGVNEGWA